MKRLSETSSEDLMLAVATGDLNAFNGIVLRHQEMVWRIAYRFQADRHAAEDIAQEAFLRVLDAAPRYRPTADFRTYLSRIVTRLCLDRARKRVPIFMETPPELADGEPLGAERLVTQETQRQVAEALASLPPRQRMAAVLRYLEGLRCAEVARTMGISVKAAERLLARARASLEPRLARLMGK